LLSKKHPVCAVLRTRKVSVPHLVESVAFLALSH
jgi:hypothetical protein